MTTSIAGTSSGNRRYAPNASDLPFDARVARLRRIANVMRKNVINMVYIAQSGHIGGSLSAADFVTALYFDLMNIIPENPHWENRDRFVLSKGHACPIWYSALALRGFFPEEELKTLRKNDSRLQGHPIATYLPGLDASTGSLGIGFGQAVGIAMEGALLKKKDYKVYVVLGDGEVNEGVVWEAALAASKYKLDNLVAIVDLNNLQLDGTIDEVMPTEPLDAKFRAFGFDVLTMDGHDMADVLTTLTKARHIRGKPVCVLAHTVKGKGVSFMEHQVDWHGKAPDDEQYRKACEELQAIENLLGVEP